MRLAIKLSINAKAVRFEYRTGVYMTIMVDTALYIEIFRECDTITAGFQQVYGMEYTAKDRKRQFSPARLLVVIHYWLALS